LSRISGYTNISNDELADIRNKIDELVNSITDSTLPQEVKLLLLRNLEALRYTLVAYRVRGIEGLQEEIERSVGFVLLHQTQINASGEKPENRHIWESFIKMIERFNKLLSFARNSKELTAPALQLIAQMFQ
jgi:hypothetical protein